VQPPPLHTFLVYYLFTISIEMSVLVVLLSCRHTIPRKLLAGGWLTACTYPVVWYVIPCVFDPFGDRLWYLLVAETFAPVAECLIFWHAFVRRLPPARGQTLRDMAAIVLANLASFGVGELLTHFGVRLV
jgi:hypothetical protein